jgi:Xaa-Pro aminopeptidase
MSYPYFDYRSRIKRLQEKMAEKGYDAVALSKFGSLCYFTGLVFKDRAAIIVPAKGGDNDIYMTNINVEIGRMREESWLPNLVPWDFARKIPGLAFNPAFSEAIADCIKKLGLDKGKIGIETDNLVVTEFETLAASLPGARLESISADVAAMQVIKEPAEIEIQRRAAEITDAGMEAAFAAIEVGAAETEIAGAAEYAMRVAGSESSTYGIGGTIGTEVASGYRSAYMYCWSMPPTQKRLQRGDIVTVDIHCMHQTYVSDLSLNAILGEPRTAQRELADVWKKGVTALLGAMKPGARIGDAAKAARKAIEEAGWGDYNAPLYGHGLGTSTRIPPTIAINNNDLFQHNMTLNSVLVITKPGVGGMRLEMPTLVTEAGGEPLCKSPLELYVREI